MPVTIQKLAGKKAFLYNGATKVASLKDVEIDVSAAILDCSDHDSTGWADKLEGLKDWKGTAKFMYLDGDTSQAAVRTAFDGDTVIAMKFYPNGSTTGNTMFSGNVIITGWKWSAPNSGPQAFDVTFEGKGALTEGSAT